jgi:hypothetical protein
VTSGVDIGAVIVSLRNIIEHDDLIPLLNFGIHGVDAEPVYGAYPTMSTPQLYLQDELQKLRDAIFGETHEEEIRQFFKSKVGVPNVIMFVQSASLTAAGSFPVPTILRMFGTLQWFDRAPDEAVSMVCLLNNAMQSIQ